jgi:hypothetical protein
MYILEFTPPVDNVDGRFNTFRLGMRWKRDLKHGDHVLLADSKRKFAFGEAIVEGVEMGKMQPMARLHACHNHNYKGMTSEEAAERIIASMQKRYGPHIATPNRMVTVITLVRIR